MKISSDQFENLEVEDHIFLYKLKNLALAYDKTDNTICVFESEDEDVYEDSRFDITDEPVGVLFIALLKHINQLENQVEELSKKE